MSAGAAHVTKRTFSHSVTLCFSPSPVSRDELVIPGPMQICLSFDSIWSTLVMTSHSNHPQFLRVLHMQIQSTGLKRRSRWDQVPPGGLDYISCQWMNFKKKQRKRCLSKGNCWNETQRCRTRPKTWKDEDRIGLNHLLSRSISHPPSRASILRLSREPIFFIESGWRLVLSATSPTVRPDPSTSGADSSAIPPFAGWSQSTHRLALLGCLKSIAEFDDDQQSDSMNSMLILDI